MEWNEQKKVLENSIEKHINFLKKKCITTRQKIKIINVITNAKILYRMNLIKFEDDWIKRMDNLIVKMILNDGGLPSTADKEVMWTREKDGGRGLNALKDLQKANFINYNIIHILNGKNIARETVEARVTEIREKINKCFLINNMELSKGEGYKTLKDLIETMNECNMCIKDAKNIPREIEEITSEEFQWEWTKKECKKRGIKYFLQIMYGNGKIMNRNDMKYILGIDLPPIIYNKICEEITNKKMDIKNKYKFKKREEIWKDNTGGREENSIKVLYTIIDGIIHIFTDGSLKKDKGYKKAGAGIFFKKGSYLNQALRVPGEQTSLAGELYGIEYALNNVPLNRKVRIVTDNKTAIRDIENMGIMNRNEIMKMKHRSIVRRIAKIIEDRKRIGSETTFMHIYSHIEEKVRKGKPEDREKWRKKIRERKEEIGYNWNIMIQGNVEADKLADIGANKGEENGGRSKEIPKGTDNYVLIDEEIIENNTYKYIKKKFHKKMKEKMYRKPKRGEGWRNANTDVKKSINVINLFEGDDKTVNFIYKTRQLMSHNRQEMHKRTQSRKRNIHTIYMEKIYENRKCILCNKNLIDDREHQKKCEFSKESRSKLIKEIKEFLKEKGANKDPILWFGDEIEIDKEESTWNEQKINNYNKVLGDLFYIPNGIKEYMEELGIEEGWEKIIDEITRKWVRGNKIIIKERIKEHNKRKETKKWKKELITGKVTGTNGIWDIIPYLKWNEIVDITEEIPYLITDLTEVRKKRRVEKEIEKEGKPCDKIKRRRKSVQIVVTGPIPQRGKKRRKV